MQVTRLFDLIPRQLQKFPKTDALSAKENGKWISYSTQQFKEFADNVARSISMRNANLSSEKVAETIEP